MPDKSGTLNTSLLALFIGIGGAPSLAQTGTWYSFQSKCNIEFSRKGATAVVILDGKPCSGNVTAIQAQTEAYKVDCGKQQGFSYIIDEGQVLILNDKYQHGCEAAKIVTMNATTDADLPEAFETYLTDNAYILDDSAAIISKAKYMNSRNRFRYTVSLLNAFIAKHPESIEAYLYLADAYNGQRDRENARRFYGQYQKRYSERHKGAQAPALRNY